MLGGVLEGGDIDISGTGLMTIKSGSVDTTELAADAVTGAKIADNAVGAAALNVSGNGTSGQALVSDGDGSFSWSTISGGTPADGSITTAKLASDAVTNAKLADNAVHPENLNGLSGDGTSGQALVSDGDGSFSWQTIVTSIADGSITSAKLADDAVTTAKIADNAITNALMADDAIDTAEIADGAVETAQLGANAVTAAKIANGSVGQNQLNYGSIRADTADKINDIGEENELMTPSASHIQRQNAWNSITLAGYAYVASSPSAKQFTVSGGTITINPENASARNQINAILYKGNDITIGTGIIGTINTHSVDANNQNIIINLSSPYDGTSNFSGNYDILFQGYSNKKTTDLISENAYSLPVADTAIGGVKEGGDIDIDATGIMTIKDNIVDATALNVSGNGTSGQALVSDGDGSFSWSTISGGSGITTASAFSYIESRRYTTNFVADNSFATDLVSYRASANNVKIRFNYESTKDVVENGIATGSTIFRIDQGDNFVRGIVATVNFRDGTPLGDQYFLEMSLSDITSSGTISTNNPVKVRWMGASAEAFIGGIAFKDGSMRGDMIQYNGINADQLNVSGNGTSGQALVSDGDGSFSWSTISSTPADGSITSAKLADDAVTAAKVADNAIGAAALNVSGNGTSGQALVSDGDGSFSWNTITGGASVAIQQTAPSNPSTGDLWVDSDTAKLYTRYDSTWMNIGNAGGGSGSEWTHLQTQATTSGNQIDFTGIPSTAKSVKILFYRHRNSNSTNGSYIAFRVGSSSSVLSTGYQTTLGDNAGSTVQFGFTSPSNINDAYFIGEAILEKFEPTDNIWLCNGKARFSTSETGNTATSFAYLSGSIDLGSAQLDRVRLFVHGTETFNAGKVSIYYQ